MQLNMFNQTFQYPNHVDEIENCFIQINQLLKESDYVLSHLEIDGIEVYTEHNDYIASNLKNIRVIEVKVITFKQLLDETVLDTAKYVNRTIAETRILADEFYKNPDKETWVKLGQLLEGLQWVIQVIQPIYQVRANELPYLNSMDYSVISTELTEHFRELEAALEHSDLVLTGDILKYEIVERLLKLENTMQTTIDNEVVRNDLN